MLFKYTPQLFVPKGTLMSTNFKKANLYILAIFASYASHVKLIGHPHVSRVAAANYVTFS